ncbi:ammonium transporter [Gordonia jinghuaiqii]|uniref:Ammonium transporter n=1 Tax=Gordonia jinghuaiqii TaxID=2758710 RepID=A0A7D7RCJ9_9ACTN|nr:ammonium transporter [Gordonia jinghuaiqii]MCR5978567.1 ammonium transporter [Gordonia jinghuaiqii]QMT02890.1 ammonium transporter [Gordonia jinghuaiqii]
MTLAQETINSGDTAWVLVCAALVLFMTPGLAFFYAGMVSRRNTLAMLQQNMIALGIITLTWFFFGYSLAFGNDRANGFIADLSFLGLKNIGEAPDPALHVVTTSVAIPTLAFFAYQMMFAIITPILATGAIASRLKPLGWAVFIGIWSVIVYAPIAHWLWAPTGWLTKLGAQDWAGGMVVHASAGAAALALLIVLGRRKVWPDRAPLPHSIPLVIVGAGILWFGWFGFNAGDGLQANGVAAQALVNTQVAAAAAMVIWLIIERLRDGHATVLGGVTGAVAGLATITPAAGYVNTLAAFVIGLLAGVVCHLALKLKTLIRVDDALDVLAVHFIGGVLGTILVGFFGEEAINAIGRDGVFHGGGWGLLGDQFIALGSVIAFSLVLTLVIGFAIDKTIGLRVDPDDEEHLDATQQGMSAYTDDPVLPIPTDDPAARLVAPQPAETGEGLYLVTAILDSAGTEGVEQEVLSAGARRAVVSEVFVTAAGPVDHIVRGQSRRVTMTPRVRVEILTPAQSVDDVQRALSDLGDDLVQMIVLPVAEVHGPAAR